MEWHEVELDGSRTIAFPERIVPGFGREPSTHLDAAEYLGGIIRDGQWGWVTWRYGSDATLLVCSMSTGHYLSWHCFWRESNNLQQRRSIRCVEELFPGDHERSPMLAICLESWNSGDQRPIDCPLTTQVLIYAIRNSQVLRRFDLDGITCSALTFIDKGIYGLTQLHLFEGCLAVATEEGTVLMVDLNSDSLQASTRNNLCSPSSKDEPSYGNLYFVSSEGARGGRISSKLTRCRSKGAHLAVRMDVASIGISCLIGISLAPGYAAGLEDGRILIYDLIHFEVTTYLQPPKTKEGFKKAVKRMCLIMPPDDPKPCFYICGLYQNTEILHMMLHSVCYRRSYRDRESDTIQFEQYRSTTMRNCQTLDRGICSVLGCSTASTFSFAGDNGTLLIVISWHSRADKKNKLVLFDINQWYKDEMPTFVHKSAVPNYMCGYILSGLNTGLALHLRSTTILHFVSLQRYDEHFYPNSLTFDCSLLTPTGKRYYAQDGVQHRFLNALRCENATIFLRPQIYHEDIVRLRILPQFCELNPNATFSQIAKYELILSVALEHNCGALLKDCARSWMDGSFLCNMLDNTQLSLLTLTNWILKRAGQIKTRCSDLCHGIFDYGGYPLDQRERREFQVLTGQLRDLVRLQSYIVEQGRRRLTCSILDDCRANERTLKTVAEYQRVLYWFIKQGLLPEGQQVDYRVPRENPFVRLRHEYSEKRAQRKFLYIDSLRKRALIPDPYPPDSLHAFIQLMLNPDIELCHKHALFLYLLMDLNQQLVRLFQINLQLDNDLAPSLRCFWYLDHGDCEQGVQELYKESAPARNLKSWQMRLLIEKLLAEGALMAAKKVVGRPPGPLSSALHMKVLLANDNIPEAFEIARLDDDEDGQPLLERFFRHCIEIRRFTFLSGLYLREPEERLLYTLLRQCRTRHTDCVQLILLLQKSKFIEAVSFMDEVAAERERDESSSSILPAYSATMGPVIQNIAGTYLRIRGTLDGLGDGQKNGPLEPFSCQLVKQNASGQLGGIFQSSAVSAHWATQCESPPKMTPVSIQSKLGYSNVPFLRHAQYGHSELPLRRRIVKPVPHQVVEKRQRDLEDQRTKQLEQRQLGTERPYKRPCLMFERMVEDVTDYVKSIREKSSNQMEQEEVKKNEATNLLQPPTFLQARKSTIRKSGSSPQPISTILKRSAAVEAVKGASPVATSTALAGPKTFRFVPPIPLRTDTSDKSMEVSSEDAAEGEEETDEIIVEIESRSEPMSACSFESDEEDEFLSPSVSANVSLMDPVPSRDSPHYFAPPAGPQPRNSLLHGGNGSGSKIGTAAGSESSSGFGSFNTVQPAQTASHSQFVPTVCSSKMGETQSQVFTSGSCGIKISERTTICGEMESTDLGAELAGAPSAQWSLPSARPAIQGHHQMMDTTLGMSTYDVASLEQPDTQDEEHEEELKLGDTKSLEEQQNPQDEQNLEQEQDQAQEPLETGGRLAFLSNSEGTAQEPLSSPIYSLSSEDSNVSSAGIQNPMLPALHTDDPMYSIVAESPGSITTSRSVTHTPTSFLPSDTNVSQTSSPQAPHGGDGDGTPISLYRANSLETVDDLDTTKGSLEEEDDDDDDDCVIALDGTEVRGYVARPQQSAASSSAELFAFKDECQEEAAGVPSPFLSLGATVNSDSDVADTIVLDSDEEAPKEKDTQPEQRKDWPTEEKTASNESVATVEFSEQKQPLADMDIEMVVDVVPDVPEMEPLVRGLEEIPEEDVDLEAEEQVVVEVERGADEQPKEGDKTETKEASEEKAKPSPQPLLPEEEDSTHSLKLKFSGDEDEGQDVPTGTIRTLQPRRSFKEHQDTPRTLRPRRVSEKHRDSPTPVAGRKMSLRSSDAPTLSHASTPPVSTPKRRGLQHTNLLEVIPERLRPQSPLEPALPRTRSRTRLSVDSEAASSRPGTPTTTKARGKRAVSQAPVTAKPSVRSLRGQSEPPPALSAQVVRKPKAARAVVSLRKMSSDAPIDAPIDVPDSTAPEELPRLRRTTRRRISELSDQSGTATGDSRSEASSSATNSTASSQNRELRPRLRRTSKSEH
ncbi:protein ELYS homolog [Drosophila sechellia]|uniref:protein ELYS homolog n=1 Tax=Drosophila sechellia TaxID=7238 RepID=UPI0013DE14B3|nr:protein ELYS homolog [Drosophila sechellia]